MISTRNTLLAALLTWGFLVACTEQSSVRGDASSAGRATSADDLLVVDCLLPGQIRRLGTQMTYLSARRPIQTTAQDCAIRGGEYVAYDRTTYQSALQLWMPLAETGDPDAQNKVGEIYERGLGGRPDYEMAALWYRRAAKQGFKRAQINLGFLYEKGLGVSKDLKTALQWYRKGSDLPDAVIIDQAKLAASQNQIAALKQELEVSRSGLNKARKDIRKRERQLQRERERLDLKLKRQPQSGTPAAERTRIAELRKQTETQSGELHRRQERIRDLESQSRRQQEKLLTLEAEGASLKEQLALVRTELERNKKDLGQSRELADESEKQVQREQAELAELKQQAERKTGDRSVRVSGLEKELGAKERALSEKQAAVLRLQKQVETQERTLAQAEAAKRTDLADVEARLAQTRSELERSRLQEQERTSELQRIRARLEAQGGADATRISELEQQLKDRENLLADRRQKVEQLQKESTQWREKLAQLERKAKQGGGSTVARAATAGVPTAPPSIQLIEPPMVGVRGELKIPVKRGLEKRTLIGRVTSSAGLYALTANGAKLAADDEGLFETEIQIAGASTPVNLVAIDKQGGRATLAFALVTEDQSGKTVARKTNPLKNVDVGGFHALVIGNQDYQFMPDLATATSDAKEVAKVLKDEFGFKVTLLNDATRYQVLSELNRLRKTLTDKDNLLIYYAGHGELDRVNLRGHWLPVDAESHSSANWISNIAITDILNAMSVRHVLVVADSCYSGSLTRSALANLDAGKSDATRTHWLKTISKMHSRTVLTSGGLAPVLDGGGGRHSVFAKAFLGVLREMDDVTEGQRVFREVAARVAFDANKYQVEQVPEYAPIKFAGHESGDFLFLPKRLFN